MICGEALISWQPDPREFTHMKFTCTLTHLANGNWLARHTGSSGGQVEVTAQTREEALTKMRNELRYRSEYCPCTGVTEDFVELLVREDGGKP